MVADGGRLFDNNCDHKTLQKCRVAAVARGGGGGGDDKIPYLKGCFHTGVKERHWGDGEMECPFPPTSCP